jgi:hypothetical protein
LKNFIKISHLPFLFKLDYWLSHDPKVIPIEKNSWPEQDPENMIRIKNKKDSDGKIPTHDMK